MISASGDATTDRALVRQERLAQGIAGVRRRAATIDTEKALQIAGSVLIPTGLVVILLGWFGAAHTSYDFEQVPYLISGGILGAAMTVAGGFLYFGYWLTRLVHEGRHQRTELAALLTSIDARMAVLETTTGAARETPGQAADGGAGQLVATPTGSLVHRADCPLVQGRPGLRLVDRTRAGLKGCKVCQPLGGQP